MERWNADKIMPMREHVYRHLKNLILEGRLKAGDRLNERDLAREMQISRTPIREALFRLEARGFVKTVPRKGVVVETVTESGLLEIFDMLAALESLASKFAAEKIDAETAEACGRWIDRIREFLSKQQERDIEKFHLQVCHFHYQTAKSPQLNLMLTDLTDYIQAFANAGYRHEGRLSESMHEHMQILDAIRNGASEKAAELSRQHIEHAKAVYLETMQSRQRQ